MGPLGELGTLAEKSGDGDVAKLGHEVSLADCEKDGKRIADRARTGSVPKGTGAPVREVRRPEWLFGPTHGDYAGELPETAILTYELRPGYTDGGLGRAVHVEEMAVNLAETWA
jgi:hypothetical protein